MIDDDVVVVAQTVNNALSIGKMLLEPRMIKKKTKALEEQRDVLKEIEKLRTKNVENVLEKTAELIDQSIQNIEIDDGWILKFIDYTQSVCDEDLQELLARILAEKINNPDSISIRSVRVLSDLSYKECNLFGRMLKYSIRQKDGTVYIPHPDVINNYKSNSFTYADFMTLSECGLTTIFDQCYQIKPEHDVNLIYNEYVGVIETEGESIDSCCISTLTTAGKEIFEISKKYMKIECDVDYFRHIIIFIANHNKKKAMMHRLVRYDKDSIDHLKENLL